MIMKVYFFVLFQGWCAKLIRAFIFQKHFYLLKLNMQLILVPSWKLFNRLQYKFHWRVTGSIHCSLKKEVSFEQRGIFQPPPPTVSLLLGGQFFMLNFLTPSFTFSFPCGNINLPQDPPLFFSSTTF